MHLQPIHPHGGQILHVERDQRAAESVAHVAHVLRLEHVLQLAREAVGLVLEPAADSVHADTDDGLEWRDDHLSAHVRASTRRLNLQTAGIRTWKRRNATMVGGRAATAAGKSNARSTGGAWRNAGKSARMENRCSWETRRSFVGWR